VKCLVESCVQYERVWACVGVCGRVWACVGVCDWDQAIRVVECLSGPAVTKFGLVPVGSN